MSKSFVALTLVLAISGAARAQEPAAPLDITRVVALAKQHSPALKASLLELEQSRWDVFGKKALYEPVLLIDGSGSQVSTVNVFGSGIRINRVRRGDLGAELKKRLLWGTDLSLRLSTSVHASRFSGGLTTLPTGTGMGGTTTIPLFGFGNFGPVYGLNAKLTLKQPLWRGRGRDVGEAQLNASRAERRGREHARDRVGSQLLRDALSAYYELWYADAAVGIQRASGALAEKQLEEAAARVRSGSVAPAEVLTFETQVATRAEELLAAEIERTRRVHELARLLGTDAATPIDASPVEPPLELRSFVRAEAEQSALENAAEIQERAAMLELARIQQRTADDPQKPRLDVDGYVQLQGLGDENMRDAAEQLAKGDVVSAMLGLTYEAPIRGRARRAEAAKARLATEIAEEQLREARQSVQAEVRAALDRAERGTAKIALAERTAEIAARQLAAEQARYRSGSSTSLAVLEAEDRLRTAHLRLARARADQAEVGLVIDHLTGDLLKRFALR